jgi:hypothetical protein
VHIREDNIRIISGLLLGTLGSVYVTAVSFPD